jgi:hypothetical protein
LYDLQTDVKTLVSRAYQSIAAANGTSDVPTISGDGRFIAYRSNSSNIVSSATNGWPNLFLYDRVKDTNTLLSVSRDGTSGANYWSLAPAFSGNGRMLVFPSCASDLVDSDLNQSGDLFAFRFLYASAVRGNGSTLISWPGTSGENFKVQFKNNIEDSDWQDLTGTITFSGDTAYIEDHSPGLAHRVYRIVGF